MESPVVGGNSTLGEAGHSCDPRSVSSAETAGIPALEGSVLQQNEIRSYSWWTIVLFQIRTFRFSNNSRLQQSVSFQHFLLEAPIIRNWIHPNLQVSRVVSDTDAYGRLGPSGGPSPRRTRAWRDPSDGSPRSLTEEEVSGSRARNRRRTIPVAGG